MLYILLVHREIDMFFRFHERHHEPAQQELILTALGIVNGCQILSLGRLSVCYMCSLIYLLYIEMCHVCIYIYIYIYIYIVIIYVFYVMIIYCIYIYMGGTQM